MVGAELDFARRNSCLVILGGGSSLPVVSAELDFTRWHSHESSGVQQIPSLSELELEKTNSSRFLNFFVLTKEFVFVLRNLRNITIPLFLG